MSTRKITKEQFSDGTTIDGNRVEEAMDNIEERFNNIPKGDVRSRYVQNQYVLGFEPQVQVNYAQSNALPWMTSLNTGLVALLPTEGAVAVTSETDQAPSGFPYNDERVKGTMPVGGWGSLGLTTYTEGGIGWVWSISHIFNKPVIIQDVMWLMQGMETVVAGYNVYPNTFRYGATAPGPKTANYGANDCSMVLQVASPYAPEERQYDLKEIAVHNRQNWAYLFNREDARSLPAFTLMIPQVEVKTVDSHLRGVMFRGEDLNIPISRDSKCTLHLVIPRWKEYNPYGDGASGGSYPPNQQSYSVVITVLEEIEE